MDLLSNTAQKIPVTRKTLRDQFPRRSIALRKTRTLRGTPAVRLEVEGVPRGAARDPSLSEIYAKIDNLKTHCCYAGKPILY